MKRFLMIFVILTTACSFAFSQKKDTKVTGQFTASQKLNITPLVTSGYVSNITISPNGKYAAYVTKVGSKQSIRLRQIATTSDVVIVSPTENSLYDLSFTPDSRYLYYFRYIEEDSKLFKVPALGGSATKIAEKIDKDTEITSPVAVSPDGKTIAFQRDNNEGPGSFLQLANADGTNERTLIKFMDPPGVASNNQAWSPDGKTVAYGFGKREKDGVHIKLLGINVSDGAQRQLSEADWSKINDIVWLSNGNLIVSGKFRADKESEPTQLWMIAPNAPPQTIAREPDGYQRLSATAKGDMLVALQMRTPLNFWITPNGDVSGSKQITTTGDILGRVRWVPGGKLAFSSLTTNGNRDIWTINSDGSNRKQLTADQGLNLLSSVTADGRFIFFIRTLLRNNVEISTIWRMDADGSNQRQLTNGLNDRSPRPSPDGRWVYYTEVTTGEWNICKISIDGGTPFKIATKKMSSPIDVSPRTGMIAYINDADWQKGGLAKIIIISADNKPIKTLLLPRTAQLQHFQWTPDESAITYQDTRDGLANIWAIPFNSEGEAQPLTNFTGEQTVDYDLSPDGKQILLIRAIKTSKAVLISESKLRKPLRIGKLKN